MGVTVQNGSSKASREGQQGKEGSQTKEDGNKPASLRDEFFILEIAVGAVTLPFTSKGRQALREAWENRHEILAESKKLLEEDRQRTAAESNKRENVTAASDKDGKHVENSAGAKRTSTKLKELMQSHEGALIELAESAENLSGIKDLLKEAQPNANTRQGFRQDLAEILKIPDYLRADFKLLPFYDKDARKLTLCIYDDRPGADSRSPKQRLIGVVHYDADPSKRCLDGYETHHVPRSF